MGKLANMQMKNGLKTPVSFSHFHIG